MSFSIYVQKLILLIKLVEKTKQCGCVCNMWRDLVVGLWRSEGRCRSRRYSASKSIIYFNAYLISIKLLTYVNSMLILTNFVLHIVTCDTVVRHYMYVKRGILCILLQVYGVYGSSLRCLLPFLIVYAGLFIESTLASFVLIFGNIWKNTPVASHGYSVRSLIVQWLTSRNVADVP